MNDSDIYEFMAGLEGKKVFHKFFGSGLFAEASADEKYSLLIAINFESGESKKFSLKSCVDMGLLTVDDENYTKEKLKRFVAGYDAWFNTNGRQFLMNLAWKKEQRLAEIRRKKDERRKMSFDVEEEHKKADEQFGPFYQKIHEDFSTRTVERSSISEEEKEEKEQIYNFLARERNVKYLVHFTPVSNIPSILKHGILSREALLKCNIEAVFPDEKRLDGHLNCSSFSISFPNYRMFYAKRNSYQTDSNCGFAMLIIDPQIILDLPLYAVSYLPDNAASNNVSKNIKNYSGYNALTCLFADYELDGLNSSLREDRCLPRHFTTNPQAEVFISSRVAPDYIRAIVTRDDYTIDKLNEMLQKTNSWKPRIVCNPSFFNRRLDWEFWKSENYTYMGGFY